MNPPLPGIANLGSAAITGNATTTSLTITALGSSGTPCLAVNASGSVATTTCGVAGAAGGDLGGTYPNPTVLTTTSNAPPTVVSVGGPSLIGAGTSLTITAPASISNGNILVAMVSVNGQSAETWTPPSGFTQVGSTVGSGANHQVVQAIFCKTASSESGNYTFSFSNGVSGGAGIGTILNISGASCANNGVGTATGNASSLTINPVSTTKVNDIVILGASQLGNNANINVLTPGNANVQSNYSGQYLGIIPSGAGTTPTIKITASDGSSNATLSTDDFAAEVIAFPANTTSSNPMVTNGNSVAADLGTVNLSGGAQIGGQVQANNFVVANGGGGGTPTNSYAFQNSAGTVWPMLILNNANSLQIDPNEYTTFVTIGSGLHAGPSFLIASGNSFWASLDASQDLPITTTDAANNLRFGNASSSGATEENDMFFQVQTAKTFHWSVNGIDQLTLNTSSLKMAEPFQNHVTTFASLPTCNSTHEGMTSGVSDAATSTWGATVAGSSSLHILAYCDGTNWTVMAK